MAPVLIWCYEKHIAFHETRTVRPRCEAPIRIRNDRDNSLRANISPSLCDAWLSRTKVLFRSDSTCSGHGTCVSVGAVGGGHACQFVRLYFESVDKLRNMRTQNCPAIPPIPCDAVNNN